MTRLRISGARAVAGRLGGRTARLVGLIALGVVSGFVALTPASGAGATTTPGPHGYIKHVVVLMQENHSFDNVFGKFCTEIAVKQIIRPGDGDGCDGATWGKEASGWVKLAPAPDIVAESPHAVAAQAADIDNGKMDGFNRFYPCDIAPTNCYGQYDSLSGPCASANGSCIPNLTALATTYAISDRTFELYDSPSWGGHLYLVTASQDGFLGDNPGRSATGPKPASEGGGWGCDSGATTQWIDSTGAPLLIPSCIPDSSGNLGPAWAGYAGPKASYIPTIFDELDAKGLSWKIYGGGGAPDGSTKALQPNGWQWAICPTFAECLYSTQREDLVPQSQVLTDAAAGALPAFSIITPTEADSQHNTFSMSEGDNSIGQIVSAIQKSSEWSSTAIFITYDDCGCFYDHIDPRHYNAQWGVRVPMVIVSPYAQEGYTDTAPTTFAGILHFAEKALQVKPLNSTDSAAYSFQQSFCFGPSVPGCTPVGLPALKMITEAVKPPTAAQLKEQAAAGKEDT